MHYSLSHADVLYPQSSYKLSGVASIGWLHKLLKMTSKKNYHILSEWEVVPNSESEKMILN